MFSWTFSVIFCYTLKVHINFFSFISVSARQFFLRWVRVVNSSFDVFSMSIRYVASKPYVDENKIAIWGWVSLHQLCDKVLQISSFVK